MRCHIYIHKSQLWNQTSKVSNAVQSIIELFILYQDDRMLRKTVFNSHLEQQLLPKRCAYCQAMFTYDNGKINS